MVSPNSSSFRSNDRAHPLSKHVRRSLWPGHAPPEVSSKRTDFNISPYSLLLSNHLPLSMSSTNPANSGKFTSLSDWPANKPLPTIRTKFHFLPRKDDLVCLSRPDIHNTCTAPYVKTHNGMSMILQPSQTDFVNGTEFTCRGGVSHVEDDGTRWSWTGPVECGLILEKRAIGSEDSLRDFCKTKQLVAELAGDERGTWTGTIL